MPTDFETQCEILSDLWLNYREDEQLVEFVRYNDLGLPLAYSINAGLVEVTDDGVPYVEETFSQLCETLNLDADQEHSSLNQMLRELAVEDEGNKVKTVSIDNLVFAGAFSVDSGQAMVGDPVYLVDWDTNKNDEWNLEGKEGQYSYHGASAVTLSKKFGMLGFNAVVFSTGQGDGLYPVYVQLNDDGRVSKVVIDFVGDLNGRE